MKKILSLIAMVVFAGAATAQQLPYYSQYMFNLYHLNPAYAGVTEYSPLSVGYRAQWVSLPDAPQTGVVSYYTRTGDKTAVGGLLFSDKIGPTSTNGLQLSYSYHLPVMRERAKVSFALAGMINHKRFDRSQMSTYSELTTGTTDPLISGGSNSSISPDANFGVFFYHPRYFAGVAMPQLFQTNMGYSAGDDNRLKRHYFINGGYKHIFNQTWAVEPSILLKTAAGSPSQLDVNVRGFYQQFLWAGVSYRVNHAVVPMIGLAKNNVSVGYSYDVTTSDIKQYTSGSHELFLSYRFEKKKQKDQPVKLDENEGDDKKDDGEPRKDEVGPDQKKKQEVGPDQKQQNQNQAQPEQPKKTPSGKRKL